jgi:hypothetical protein
LQNGTEEDELDIDGTISKTGSCQYCTDDFASKILVSYIHQEEQSESRINANILLRLLIDGVPYTVTTRNEYFVKGEAVYLFVYLSYLILFIYSFIRQKF